MRLVVVWDSGDGCTYSCENVQCLEYKSAEDFLVDFDAWKQSDGVGIPFYYGEGFAGTDLGPDIMDVEVYELEEWFEKTQRKLITNVQL